MMDYLKHRITKVCLIAGFIVTGILLWQIGFQNVEHHIALIGLGIFPIFLVSVLWKCTNTIAWAIVFTPDTPENHPGFRKLLVANLAGDVINNMVPTAGVGGELIKPYFLKSWISVSQSFSAVVLNKTCEILSGIVFTALSLLMALMVWSCPVLVECLGLGLQARV